MKFVLDQLQPRGLAGIDLATGFGDEAKWLAKTVKVSDGIVDGAKAADALDDVIDAGETIIKSSSSSINNSALNIELNSTKRLRKSLSINTGMIIPREGPFDIGHKKGQSWNIRKQAHINEVQEKMFLKPRTIQICTK